MVMEIIRGKPLTLVKISTLKSNLSDIAQKYDSRLKEFPEKSISTKYYLFEEEQPHYSLMVSKSTIGMNNIREKGKKYRYNLIFTVTSRDEQRNEQVARDFQQKTGVKLEEPPGSLERLMQDVGITFIKLEKMHGLIP